MNTDRAEALDILRPLLPVGATVYTRVLSVSRSGMSRTVSAHVIATDPDGRPYPHDISGLVARAIGNHWADNGGVVMTGSGMDMTFALVYALGRALFPEGHKCTGSTGYTPTGRHSKAPRCPSNDHSNDYGVLARRYDAAHPGFQVTYDEALSRDDATSAHGLRTDYVAARQAWISEQRPYSRSRVHSDGGYALNNQGL